MHRVWFGSLTDYIGIDMGSSRIRIWSKQSGVVVDDATAIALDTRQQKVIAVGQEAAQMLGRVAPHISVLFPLQADGISESDIVAAMLRVFLQRVFRLGLFFRPVMVVTVHSHYGEPERQALVELFLRVGAREVYLVDEVLAAAIGAGVPIADASGSLFLHAGASTAEVGMISLGSVVRSEAAFFAGQNMTRELQLLFKDEYGILVGTSRTDQLKAQILGTVQPPVAQFNLTGQSIISQSPIEVTINVEKLEQTVKKMIKNYIHMTTSLLGKLPPELSQDVLEKGMLISGGTSQLRQMVPLLSAELGFPVSLVDDPLNCVIKGVGQIVSNIRQFTESIGYQSR